MNILLIGAGTIAHQHAHTAMALGLGDRLQIADPSSAARERFAGAFPSASVHADVATLLAKPADADDIAIVATPPAFHLEHASAALASGRNVLCEKPLAMTEVELSSLHSHWRKSGKSLACCSNRWVTGAATARLLARLSAGDLGELYSVTWRQLNARRRTGIEYQPGSHWFLDRSLSGGGCLMDWSPYDFAMLHTALQPQAVEIVHAFARQPEVPTGLATDVIYDIETHGGAIMRYHLAGDRVVTVQFERASATYAPEGELFCLTGTRGSLAWEWKGFQGPLQLTHRHEGAPQGETETFAHPGGLWFHYTPLVEFVKHLRGEPNASLLGADALFCAALLRGVYTVAETGRALRVGRAAFV